MPTGSEAFLELPVVLGFGPAIGPTLKTALCHIRTLVGGHTINKHIYSYACQRTHTCNQHTYPYINTQATPIYTHI